MPCKGWARIPITVEDINWRPPDAPQALRSLEVLTDRLREQDDHRAVFLDVYVVITRNVVGVMKVEGHDGFLDPDWLSALTGRFAEEALVAVQCSLEHRHVSSAAWRYASHYAANKLTQPYQDALLGVSAHINYDLGLVCYGSFEAQRAGIDDERLLRYRHDYMRVNRILEASLLECIDLLIDRYDCRWTKDLVRSRTSRLLVCQGLMRMLESWRARVWNETMELWRAPGEQERRAIVERMDLRAARIAQAIYAGDITKLWSPAARRWPPRRASVAEAAARSNGHGPPPALPKPPRLAVWEVGALLSGLLLAVVPNLPVVMVESVAYGRARNCAIFTAGLVVGLVLTRAHLRLPGGRGPRR